MRLGYGYGDGRDRREIDLEMQVDISLAAESSLAPSQSGEWQAGFRHMNAIRTLLALRLVCRADAAKAGLVFSTTWLPRVDSALPT